MKMKKNSAILVFDAGNTAVTYAFYYGGRVHAFGSSSVEGIAKLVQTWSKKIPSGTIHHAAISSVDPQKTRQLQKIFSAHRQFKVWIAGKNLPVKIQSLYRPAKTLGIDRVVLIHGALAIYKPPFLLIDFGTAITFDYVSKKGIFEGGLIVPGPGISFKALMEKTALLPKNLKFPNSAKSFLGKTTLAGMTSGILEGFGALTDELIERFRNRFGKNLRVIATGGYAETLQRYSRLMDFSDPRLSVNALLLLTKAWTRKKH